MSHDVSLVCSRRVGGERGTDRRECDLVVARARDVPHGPESYATGKMKEEGMCRVQVTVVLERESKDGLPSAEAHEGHHARRRVRCTVIRVSTVMAHHCKLYTDTIKLYFILVGLRNEVP